MPSLTELTVMVLTLGPPSLLGGAIFRRRVHGVRERRAQRHQRQQQRENERESERRAAALRLQRHR